MKMIKWILALVLSLGILAGCSPVGPDPQFDNEYQLRDYCEDEWAKLIYIYEQELSKIKMAREKGEITYEEYLEMSDKIYDRYIIEVQKLRDKYGEHKKS